MNDYTQEAKVTLSSNWHGENVSAAVLRAVIGDAIDSLSKLDKIKKALFYGKDLPENFTVQGIIPVSSNEFESCFNIPKTLKDDENGKHIIHGIIGLATECAELLEALEKVIFKRENFDETNIKEEVGDIFWYLAILADSCGFDFNSAQKANIAKLRARYPNRFTEFDANNRDLIKERQVLENESAFEF